MVAKHREPPDLVDPRLKEFVRADWEKPSDTSHFDAFRSWKAARADFVAKHPDALGDVAERFRLELQVQMSQYDPRASSWDDYKRGGTSFGWESKSAEPAGFTQPPHGQYPHKPLPRKQSRKERKR